LERPIRKLTETIPCILQYLCNILAVFRFATPPQTSLDVILSGRYPAHIKASEFDSSPVVILSAEQAKHVGDEENQQYCPQPYAGPAARTPAGMPVVPSTEAKDQYQDDDEYQHFALPIFDESRPKYLLNVHEANSAIFVEFLNRIARTLFCCVLGLPAQCPRSHDSNI
jgi:hypothetical protein